MEMGSAKGKAETLKWEWAHAKVARGAKEENRSKIGMESVRGRF